jgi:histidyl-tRNA synthetase
LGPDSLRRLDSNPLRILDTKNPKERELLRGAPRLGDSLTSESREHFDGVRTALDSLGVHYQVAPELVRGLDYYTHTVFEIVSEGLGSQNAIVGGGRYDQLVADLGGPDLPAIGFAIGQDRLIDVLPSAFRERELPSPPVVIVMIDPVPVIDGMQLADDLRRNDIAALVEFGAGSVSSAFKKADRRDADWVVLIGEAEQQAGTVTCKNMRTGEQNTMARQEIGAYLRSTR